MLGFSKESQRIILFILHVKEKWCQLLKFQIQHFQKKFLGDGFAVIPSEGKIYAPADGESDVGV